MKLLKTILKHNPVTVTRNQINKLPFSSGIYLFHNHTSINYVGKSINIKARVKSHIENAKKDSKEAGIVNSSDLITHIVTDTEFNALLLESELIKKFRPKFNVRWRDDKSYLYIKITIKDAFPKINPVRKENDHSSLYFGPFSSVRQVYEIINTLRRVFPFCTQKKLSKTRCFYAKIGLCDPCPNEINSLSETGYKKVLKRRYRNNIKSVIRLLRGDPSSVLDKLYRSLNVFKREQKFEEAIKIRNRIQRLERILHTRSFISNEDVSYNLSEDSVRELVRLLKPFYPTISKLSRIECFDVSNLSGTYATASMVVFIDGLSDKGQYRRFKIKNLRLKSDFEMLEEVIRRRFNNNWDKPSLVVVDGGKPQIRRIKRLLSSINNSTPLIGIAKNPDRLILGTTSTTLKPRTNNPGFNLLRQIRDESHRFAKRYHLLLHSKSLLFR